MTATGVQIRFAAEFALFLVSLGGLGFAFIRKDLLVVRPAARAAGAVGFAALATAALCSGALVVDDPSSPAVVALRLGGVVLLALASTSWQPGTGGRELLRIGLVALILAEVGLAADSSSVIADAARGIGALSVGACLISASARSIAARVAASGATILFGVITVIAVAMSSIVNDNIEGEALRGYGARARTEAVAIEKDSEQMVGSARLLAEALSSTGDADLARALERATDPARDPSQSAAERARVADAVSTFLELSEDPRLGPALVVGPSLRADVFVPPNLSRTVWTELAGLPLVRDAVEARALRQSVVGAGGELFSLAIAPIGSRGQPFRGVVVVTRVFGATYFEQRAELLAQEQSGTIIVLADPNQILAEAGGTIPRRVALDLAEAAESAESGSHLDRIVGDRFVVARPVNGPNGSVLGALILSAPRIQEDATRQDIFRALFLIAMGAATAALVVAGLAGDRIGAGLRRLTAAATAIDEGNLNARAGITTDDELGVLGASFDRMAHSLHTMTADLRTAVDDEAELRGRLEAVVAGMGEALVAVDADGVITDFNAAAEELFDLRAADARLRLVTSVVKLRSESGTDLSRRLGRPVLEPWTATAKVRLQDGREIPVVVSAGALRGLRNEVTGAVFVLRDLRNERELERMRAEFLANISHELRTPLTPIKGFASLLSSRRVTPAKAREFASEINTAADELDRVIAQLVNFATVADGQLALDVRPIALRPLVDRVLKGWRERVGEGHRLIRRVPAGLPRIVADATYLTQLLDELVDNAVKYSPDGGTIIVEAGVIDGEDGPAFMLSVSDQGIGIPTDQLEAILGDFTQGDASTTRKFGGLGLGLALVRRIARAHGGTLLVESVPDKGSRVAVVLPIDGTDGGRSG